MKLSQRIMAASQMAPKPSQKRVVPFGEWMPDRPEYIGNAAMQALNVIPSADGYRPFPSLSVETSTLDARCQGFAAAQDSAGNVTLYAGDATKLYSLGLGTSTWSDASKSGGYSTTADDSWEFALYGSTFIATNYTDAVQSITLGGTAFDDLITGTNKPKARHIDVVREFVVLGNTNDATDGVKPNRVWWSAIDNPLNFDPAAATQSDYQDIPDLGWVQRIVGGAEYGLIFMERNIVRMTYVGSPLVFRFDTIDRRRGTPIPNSVIGFGRLVFYISEEGFFVTDGSDSQPIGQNKVDRTFWDQFDTTYISRVSAAIDPVNKLVMWAFPGTGSTGEANVVFAYNWADGRWSQIAVDVECLARVQNRGLSLDELDTISTDLDALPFSLDSRAYTGGEVKLSAMDTSHRLAYFDGPNLAATIETPLVDLGRHSMVNRLHPLVGASLLLLTETGDPILDEDGEEILIGTVTAQLDSRAALHDDENFGTAGTMNDNGDVTLRGSGRYHKVRVSIDAGTPWTHAQGVEVTMPAMGVR